MMDRMQDGRSLRRLIEETSGSIIPLDEDWRLRGIERLDSLTKPQGSLGRLEEVALKVATILRTCTPDVTEKAIVLMAGDHGVTAQGVSPFPQEVTVQMVANFDSGGAAISQLSRWCGADLVLVDVGVASDLSHLEQVRQVNVRRGTSDISIGPAMSVEEAEKAVYQGIVTVEAAVAEGATLIGTGEMGIGNTTAAASVICALTGAAPEDIVGPGTGLDEVGVAHKAEVVQRALSVNTPDPDDAWSVLSAVGGLELAGLVGVMLGGAALGRPVVVDGYITTAAAMLACAMAEGLDAYLIASHLSGEPGHATALQALGLEPLLDLEMRLGEGTGAAIAMGVIDAACRTMSGMATFAEAGVSDKG